MAMLKSQFSEQQIYNFVTKEQVHMSQSSYSLEQPSESQVRRPYNRVTPEKKQELFLEVFQKQMKITKAARKIGINVSTAKFLIKQYKKNQLSPKKTNQQTAKVLQNPTSTEQENPPQEYPNLQGLFQFYYPFYPNGLYPWTTGSCPLGFNAYYHPS